jgi:hypothetical protein
MLPVALGIVLAMALASACAAEPLRDHPATMVGGPMQQAVPPSELSRIRGTGISAPVLLEPAARVRLWDELQRRANGAATPSQPGMSMGTLTITVR